MSVEERILIVAAGISYTDSRELRAIALEARKMEDRIKRLEEAGDALENDNYTSDNLEAWRKAKEDK